MSGKALLIGINEYKKYPLFTCVNDVNGLSELLSKHGDGSKNFDVLTRYNLTCDQLQKEIDNLFKEERAPDHALLYFSGHGYVGDSSEGFLVGKDYDTQNKGVSLNDLAEQIQGSSIKEITLIFDCCHAGVFGSIDSVKRSLTHLPKNVTLLAAVTENDYAFGGRQYGKYTELLIKGLEGEAADKNGWVTAASLHQYISNSLSSWEQRPVFKSYMTSVAPLRKIFLKDSKKDDTRETLQINAKNSVSNSEFNGTVNFN